MDTDDNQVDTGLAPEPETHLLDNSTDKETTEQHTNGLTIEEPTEESDKKCVKLGDCCHSTGKPFRTKYHPVTDKSSCCSKFIFNFMCPPHGTVGSYLQFFLLVGITFAIIISVTNHGGLPGGNFFSLTVLFFAATVGGYLINFARLPPLLGKLKEIH